MANSEQTSRATLDAEEVERFSRMSSEWWDPAGKFRPLHKLGPARIGAIRDLIAGHFGRDVGGARPLAGLGLVDIGCGGGLVAEPLTRLGASVTGIDPSQANIEAARIHAEGQGLGIEYRVATVEELAAEGRRFDCVLCLEVVEHVPDVGAFLKVTAELVQPGGLMVLSTLNRTLKSFALAIVGAEYVLRWLPVGTHQWQRFVTPDELAGYVSAAGLEAGSREGLVYNPLADRWSRSSDTDVNYIMAAAKR
ncbi:MAG: ubiquinone biosynthesis O-methyltransferase [Pseudomonadota bacterium]|jgi:2-polyprenyl-6-hydroxyphenyl methylase/3-demethylubiquinone-9 3-methyltransferase